MFDKFTKKLTKKVVTNAKETVKDEVDNYMPIVLGLISIGVALFSMNEPKQQKTISETKTIINNYYIYLGGNK